MKAQITLFVVIAILIVASVGTAAYFTNESARRKALAEKYTIESLKEELRPVEQAFIDCLKERARQGLDIAGVQGGYIKQHADEPSSSYMPFSNKLDFLGAKIPYWWYISGNNIVNSKVPKLSEIDKQIEDYMNENIGECDLDSFFSQGFEIIEEGAVRTSAVISDDYIDFEISKRITISDGDVTGTVDKHAFRLPVRLGRLYRQATAIYNLEQSNLFLENYTVDAIALYAPVSGFELSCSPKIWLQQDIENKLKKAIEANIGAIKLKGDYYSLNKAENKYFVQNIQAEKGININFLYNPAWPFKMSVNPSSNGFMRADPVGLQQGIGILGFCIVPYHFVYDLNYPVLVQIYDPEQNYLFQFPMLVSVFRNKPRTAELSYSPIVTREICSRKVQQAVVNVMDYYGKPVNAAIKFKCLDTICEIGNSEPSSEGSILVADFPQCVNGFVLAEAEGYAPTKQMASTNQFGIFDIIMMPLHNLNVNFNVEGKVILSATESDGYSTTIVYPGQNKISLKAGNYQIKAYLIKEGNFKLASQSTEKCITVPAAGVEGMIGLTTEQCFDLNYPAIDMTELPAGGATFNWTVSEDELSEARQITFNLNSYAVPKTADELVNIYNLIEREEVEMPTLR